MNNDHPDTYYDDLILFVYDLPPVADPDGFAIAQTAIRFPRPSLAEARISGARHPVIGITAAGWMMIGGVGWRLIEADKTVTQKIASACNRVQRSLLPNRPAFDRAYERCSVRSSSGVSAGLRQIHLGGGQICCPPR